MCDNKRHFFLSVETLRLNWGLQRKNAPQKTLYRTAPSISRKSPWTPLAFNIIFVKYLHKCRISNKFLRHIEGIERKFEANTPLAAPISIHFPLVSFFPFARLPSVVCLGVRHGCTFHTVSFPMCQITSKCIRSHRHIICYLFATFSSSSTFFFTSVRCQMFR